MKEIIGAVTNGRADLGFHPQWWWSKESTINKRKIVLEEIHHLEEVRRIATVVGQRNGPSWRRQKTGLSRVDLKHMEPPKLNFLIKAVYDFLPTPVNLHAWKLTTCDRCSACGKTYSYWRRVCSKKLHVETMKSLKFLPRLRRYVVRQPIKL